MSSFLPLRGDGFVLREFLTSDAAALAAIEFDPAVKGFLCLPELQREEWIRQFDAAAYGGLAIEVDGRLAGRGSVLPYRAGKKGYAEIAVLVGQTWWGTGLGRRVAAVLIDIAFDHLGAKGVVGVVHPKHHASISLLRALGFRKRAVVQGSSQPWQDGHLIYRLPRRGSRL